VRNDGKLTLAATYRW